MTLQEAIDHTWEVYQQKMLEAMQEDSQNCYECAEEHRQLHEWLSKLKRVAKVVSYCQNGEHDCESVMSVIERILEEGDGV